MPFCRKCRKELPWEAKDDWCDSEGSAGMERHSIVAALKPEKGLSTKRSTTTSPVQREKNKQGWCVVCLGPGTDPAHLIAVGFSTIGQEDDRATIPLCRRHHDEYDKGGLDLLPYEHRFLPESAYAVERFGIVTAYRRISNQRDPDVQDVQWYRNALGDISGMQSDGASAEEMAAACDRVRHGGNVWDESGGRAA